MKHSWRYFIVLNETKYGLSNIVENKDYSGEGLPLCQDFSVAINFSSPDELIEWVIKNTNLNIENGDYHIEGHYLPDKESYMYTSYINYAPKGSIYLGRYKKLSDARKACDEALELLKNVDVIYRPIIIGE